MTLHIKSEEAHRLARELERLAPVRSASRPSLAQELLAIGKDTAPRLREPYKSAEHGDLLYDQNGLPK